MYYDYDSLPFKEQTFYGESLSNFNNVNELLKILSLFLSIYIIKG